MRFSSVEVAPGDVHVEELQEGQSWPQEVVVETLLLGEGVEPDLAEEQTGVLRRRRRGRRDPGVANGEHEAQRVGVRLELAGLDELDDHGLLVLGVGRHPFGGVGNLEVLQSCERSVHPRLA